MSTKVKLNLKRKAIELLTDVRGFSEITYPVVNIENEIGEVYQLHLVLTRDEDQLSPSTSLPDMILRDGRLVEK